jgi:C-terminal processing protease CtpA/Prc
MLSDQPLAAPKHRMSITPADIVDALPGIEALKQIQTDGDAQQALGSDWSGYPVTLSFANALRDNLRFMVSEWRQAKKITDPFYVGGVDMINPSFVATYTKPVMVVVNELCFSGGDFFPAILQDNKRATIFGHRTAGAGGYVNEGQVASLIGVEYFTITGSIAERVDGNPIENLGVKPDVAYDLTASDMQKGFQGYASAIQKGIDSLLPKK